MTTTTPAAFAVGARVRTHDHGYVGRIVQLHDTCPMGAAQRMSQDVPLDDADVVAPWISVHVEGGGSMYAPTTRATVIEAAPESEGRASRYVLVELDLPDGSNGTPDPDAQADLIEGLLRTVLPGTMTGTFTVGVAYYGETIGADDDEPAPVWPENDDERASFADWQREVGEGDTVRGFRDWLAANAESEDSDTEPEDRNDRTVWRLTAADLDDHAGRTLTDEQLDAIAFSMDHSSVSECVHGAIDQLELPDTDDEDDEPDTRDERADRLDVGQTYGEYGDDPADYVTITRVKHKGDTVKVKGTLPDGSAAERTHDRDEVVALVI